MSKAATLTLALLAVSMPGCCCRQGGWGGCGYSQPYAVQPAAPQTYYPQAVAYPQQPAANCCCPTPCCY